MCLVDQLPSGSVLTPAISCKKFKIHSAYADSPMAKTVFLLHFLGRTSFCFTDQETQEENVLDGPTPLWVSTYTSYPLYKVQDPFSACRQSHGQNSFLFNFFGRTGLCLTDQETQKRMCLMDQLPCGSVLTPAISCSKFKIHLAHADSPMAKTVFFSIFFGRTSLCFTDQETQKENVLDGPTPLWVSTYTSYPLYKVQDPFSACRQSHGQNSFLFNFFGRTGLCLTDQETQKRMCLMDQLPCRSVLTPAISCSKFKIHLAHADSPMAKTVFFSIFSGGPVFASQIKKLRKRMCLVDQLPCGSVLTPAIPCTKFKIHSAHADSPMAKTVFLFNFFGRTSVCFTDQETQEENVLGGPTPLWVSTYTSYPLYKVQDPFSACRQSHGQNSFSFQFFWEDQCLLHRSRNSGRECAWWTNSLVGQYLHQLSLIQSSRSI